MDVKTFAPTAPHDWLANPHEWLSSLDIDRVMKLYEDAHPTFDFLGPSPIDFDKKVEGEYVWEELAKFNAIKSIRDNKTKIGVIVNTDPHDKPGEHWICMFIDLAPSDGSSPYAFFMDSAGDKMPAELRKLYKRAKNQLKTIGKDLKLEYPKDVIHQKDDNECGIYCIYVITSLLEGNITVEDLKTKRITDQEMFDLRYTYFNYPNQDK